MGYWKTGKQLDEKATTIGTILRKWKKFKMAVILPQSGPPCNSLWGINDHEESERSAQNTQQDLVKDLKKDGTTALPVTIVIHYTAIDYTSQLMCNPI